MSGVRITLLCEDSQTDAFVRRFLRRRNFGARDVRTLPLPKGRQSGEQWVRQRYPAELRAIRGRQGAYLIVVTDADDRSTNERRAQLGAACAEQGVPVRTGEDPVLLIVPRRNIETWLAYLDAGEPVDEEVKYPRLKRERRLRPALFRDFSSRPGNRRRWVFSYEDGAAESPGADKRE